MLFALSPWDGCAGGSASGLGHGDQALTSAHPKPFWAPLGGREVPLPRGDHCELKRRLTEATVCASAVFTHISSWRWLPAQVSPRCPRAAPLCCSTEMASVLLSQAWRALVLCK